MIHNLKIKDKFADAVLNGEKTFEVRYNDRGYNKGDQIIFTVINDFHVPIQHPLNSKVYEIVYVLSGYGIREDFVVFSIKRVDEIRRKMEQKKGKKWIVTGTFNDFLKCPDCGYKKPWNQDIFNFCPKCGTDMRG